MIIYVTVSKDPIPWARFSKSLISPSSSPPCCSSCLLPKFINNHISTKIMINFNTQHYTSSIFMFFLPHVDGHRLQDLILFKIHPILQKIRSKISTINNFKIHEKTVPRIVVWKREKCSFQVQHQGHPTKSIKNNFMIFHTS